MNNSTIGFVGVGAGVVTLLAMGMGPLNPPAGPVSSTGVTLEQIYSGLPQASVPESLEAAGIQTGNMSGSFVNIGASGPGTIRTIVVSFGDQSAERYPVELTVDGKFAGGFKSGIYENLNIHFNSNVKARVTWGPFAAPYSVSVYYALD